MTYSNVQLDIIRQFGSKELSEGCLVSTTWWIWKIYKNDDDHIFFVELQNWELCVIRSKNSLEILWHIPELFPDVARVAKEKEMDLECFISSFTDKYCIWFTKWPRDAIQSIPYNPTLPLIDQDSQLTLIPLLNLLWTK